MAGQRWRGILRHEWIHYFLLSLLIMGPLLGPGFIFTLDMAFAPVMPMPEQVSNNYLFGALLHILTLGIPGQIIQKILLMAIIVLAGAGMHQLVRSLLKLRAGEGPWPAYVAGLLYVLNPFVYSRFMAGQYLVLLGYALLPFFLRWLLRFVATPSWGTAVKLSLLTTLISIVSIHAIGMMAIIVLIVVVGALWHVKARKKILRPLIIYGGAALALFALLSSYWLIPLIGGQGSTAEVLQSFTAADHAAFATEGEGALAKLNQVFHFQGFWLEGQNLFDMPQEKFIGWGMVWFAIWLVVLAGLVSAWRQRQRHITAIAGALIIIGAWLGSGLSQSWFAVHVPFAEGYRDPQKFVALVVLGAAIGFAFGVKYSIQKLAQQPTLQASSILAFLILPLLFASPMLWGFGGQLQAKNYPSGWYEAKRYLDNDHTAYKVLFVPWHQYTYFGFANSLVANPAPKFFAQKIIVSRDPEFANLTPPAGGEATKVGQLLQHPEANLSSDLKHYGVKYIVRAKELDYDKYDFIAKQSGFRLLLENESLQLYQNEAY